MPTFSFAAYSANGQKVEGTIDASDRTELDGILIARGLHAYRVDVARDQVATSRRRGRSGIPTLRDYAVFTRQAAALLRAEIPVDQCMRLIVSQAKGTRIAMLASDIGDAIVAGQSLSEAVERVAPAAPLFMAPLIRSSEARGKLVPGLLDLAGMLERQLALREQMRGAFAYPGFLLVVALAMLAMVLGLLVPTLLPLFKDSGAEVPWLLSTADKAMALAREPKAQLVAAGGVLGLAVAIWKARRVVRGLGDRLLDVLPVVGPLRRRLAVALAARTLGTLLRNGVALIPALTLTAGVSSSASIRSAFETASEDIKEGGRLSLSLRRSGVIPDATLRFVAIGEEASRLDEMLLHLADVSEADNERQISALLTLLTPALTLLIGGFVGAIILSVIKAVLSINDIAIQ